MLQRGAFCNTKLPFVFKAFVLSSFEWPFKTGFTVLITYTGVYHSSANQMMFTGEFLIILITFSSLILSTVTVPVVKRHDVVRIIKN